jgi:hypothetical protein
VSSEGANPPVLLVEAASLHRKMLHLLSGLWVSQSIAAFARLGLADAIEDGAEDHTAIAAARGLVPDRVYRLLRALSSVGIVSERIPGRFQLTPLGRLLGSHSPVSMRTAAIVLNEYQGEAWRHLDNAVASGRTGFETMMGQPMFDWLAEHPDEAKRFHRMMIEIYGPETPALVHSYDFSPFHHIIDIGGGNGSLISAIVAAYPGRRATLFDLPEGIAAAERGEGGPLPGVTLTSGDVFAAVPEGGDAYLLRHVLHNHDDEDCLRILVNIRRAMLPHARVLVMETVVPSDASPGPGRWLDLHMMLLHGGRERTLEEFARLFANAGLYLSRTVPTSDPAAPVIEAVAANPGVG